jgi:hypothetical protein
VTISNIVCPICAFPDLAKGPLDEAGTTSYEICPSCGFEFGYDDGVLKETYESYRAEGGRKWWSESQPIPAFWNPNEKRSAE